MPGHVGVKLIVIIGWLLCLILHEWAHAIVAYYGGDTSVKEKGYLTMNPLKYAHPVTSLLLPLGILFLGGIGLPGGAVYIDHSRLKSRWWDTCVSFAGPAINLATILLIALLFHPAISFIGVSFNTDHLAINALAFLTYILWWAVMLNMLPIPPLDGFQALAPWMPVSFSRTLQRAGWMPMLILFILIMYTPVGRHGARAARFMTELIGADVMVQDRGQAAFFRGFD